MFGRDPFCVLKNKTSFCDEMVDRDVMFVGWY